MYANETLTVIGFVVSVSIAYWVFKRTEVSRIKDVFVSKAEDLPVWLLSQLNEQDLYQIESLYSGKITHLEMRLKQFNRYARHDFASGNFFNDLRNVDIEALTKEDAFRVHGFVLDLVERIEEEYFELYYSWYSRFIKPNGAALFFVFIYSFHIILLYLIFR